MVTQKRCFSCWTLSQPSHDAKVSPNARRNGFQRDVALHSPRVSFGNPFLNARFLTAIAAVAAEHDIPALRRFAGVAAHVLPRRQIRPRRMCQPFLPCLSAVNASPFEVEFNHILPNIFGDAHLFPVDVQSFNHVVPRGHLSVPFDPDLRIRGASVPSRQRFLSLTFNLHSLSDRLDDGRDIAAVVGCNVSETPLTIQLHDHRFGCPVIERHRVTLL